MGQQQNLNSREALANSIIKRYVRKLTWVKQNAYNKDRNNCCQVKGGCDDIQKLTNQLYEY